MFFMRTVLVKKYTPCQGVVWSQYRLSGKFWCGFVCQGVFFHTNCNAVLKSCTFYTGSIVALLDLIFKLQYLMNYSSNFNNFCRLQLLAVCTTLL